MRAARSRIAFLVAGAVVLVTACGATNDAAPFRRIDALDDGPPRKVSEHARLGARGRDAVERGDVVGARQAAHDLIELVLRSETPAPKSRLADMLEAAHVVEEAKDLDEATRAFAALSNRCGLCHAAIGGPRSVAAVAPAAATSVASHMRRHQWASARLWEGLVAPSDEAWRSGAQVLAEAPFDPEGSMGKTAVPEIQALAQATHELGVKATAATGQASRVELYGRILGTCAGCHQRGPGGGPGGGPG